MEVCKRKNQVWEVKCTELDRFMGGTKVAEAWKILKSVRKDEKYGTNMRLIRMKQWEEHYKGLRIHQDSL